MVFPVPPPQVLQKLGKTVETKDEQFEQSAHNFQLQQVTGGAGTPPLRPRDPLTRPLPARLCRTKATNSTRTSRLSWGR